MRAFMVTGEASGDMLAAALGEAMRRRVPEIELAGIGNERMEAAGFTLTTRTRGWASLGPIEALARIPPLLVNCWRHALWLRRRPWDLIVLVDFGAYNLRLASYLRLLGYRRPILYVMPPGAWLDRPTQARAVARATTPLTAFAHQRDFYERLGLRIAYFGHPLRSLVRRRPPQAAPPRDAGIIAILPGSRAGEVERHAPPLIAAAREVLTRRPAARFIVGAADGDRRAQLDRLLGSDSRFAVCDGARTALEHADAAWVASGTAVLEATLGGVAVVALYIVARSQARIARRIWRHPYVTLPNILLGRMAIPELLQEAATPAALAAAIEPYLLDPEGQERDVAVLRTMLGEPDALDRCADFAVELARR